LATFIETVLPELRRRGLHTTPPAGGTLRGRLGLPYPAHPSSLERAS
jgi:hypothetical protein